MVAAWISAEIGVGLSIESGSHTCSGTCADLTIAPTNRQMQITVAMDHSWPEMIDTTCPPPILLLALANTVEYSSVPQQYLTPATPRTTPHSPTHCNRNALRSVNTTVERLNQKQIPQN